MDYMSEINNLEYQKKWQEVQKLTGSEYYEYFNKSIADNKMFRFFLITRENEEKYQWTYRVMTRKPDGTVSFAISAASDPFSGKARPLMVDKETFIKLCLEQGISQDNLEYFFSKKMEMTAEDWENF